MNKSNIIIVFKTTIVLLLILFIPPLFFGYRLMFIQEYVFDLDATEKICSIIFGIIGTVATVAAIWTAILVPKQIAQRQNDIALFEKRFTVYQKIKMIYLLNSSLIHSFNSCEDYDYSKKNSCTVYWIIDYFKPNKLERTDKLNVAQLRVLAHAEISKCLSEFRSIVNSSVFLFNDVNYNKYDELLTSLKNLVDDCYSFYYFNGNLDYQEKAILAINNFLETCVDFETKYLTSIESQLHLNKKEN